MMKTPLRIVIVAAVLAGAVAPKQGCGGAEPNNISPAAASASTGTTAATAAPVAAARLPKLLDLGATKCIPCRMMAPVLEGLKRQYAGRLDVQFIDVWENPDAAKQHKIEMIPTQIFYSAAGKELFRHIGFYGREDILAQWKELDVDLGREPAPVKSKHD